MFSTRTALRAGTPLAAAVIAVGLLSSPAWANPPGRPGPPPPPPPVTAGQCIQGHGHVVTNPRDRRIHTCQGGRWNGRGTR
jgi:hypothetical protein